jgi:hypothetical protein
MTDEIPTKKRKITKKFNFPNYKEYDGTEPEFIELENLLNHMFPNSTIKDYAMTIFAGCLCGKITDKIISFCGDPLCKDIFNELIFNSFKNYIFSMCYDDLLMSNCVRCDFNTKDIRLLKLYNETSETMSDLLFERFVNKEPMVFKSNEKSGITKLNCSVLMDHENDYTYPKKFNDRYVIIPFSDKVKLSTSEHTKEDYVLDYCNVRKYVHPFLWLLLNKCSIKKIDKYSKVKFLGFTKYITDDICDQIYGFIDPQF